MQVLEFDAVLAEVPEQGRNSGALALRVVGEDELVAVGAMKAMPAAITVRPTGVKSKKEKVGCHREALLILFGLEELNHLIFFGLLP